VKRLRQSHHLHHQPTNARTTINLLTITSISIHRTLAWVTVSSSTVQPLQRPHHLHHPPPRLLQPPRRLHHPPPRLLQPLQPTYRRHHRHHRLLLPAALPKATALTKATALPKATALTKATAQPAAGLLPVAGTLLATGPLLLPSGLLLVPIGSALDSFKLSYRQSATLTAMPQRWWRNLLAKYPRFSVRQGHHSSSRYKDVTIVTPHTPPTLSADL